MWIYSAVFILRGCEIPFVNQESCPVINTTFDVTSSPSFRILSLEILIAANESALIIDRKSHTGEIE